ncbi:MAG: TcpQ domain-containing protein [Pseudoxanthomonas sp.]
MKHKALGFCWGLLIVLALNGCATRPAPDFAGRWKAVNRYATSTEEIPLNKSYFFHASPMDGTLRSMLTRWASDSKMKLAYLHTSDFTLYAPVAQIRTNDLQQAVSQLTAAYAAQRVSVQVKGSQIVVQALPVEPDGSEHAEAAGATTP